MTLTEIPLLAPKRVSEFTPQEWLDYVTALHRAPEVRATKPPITFARTKTGKPSVKVTGRNPPYIMQSEFIQLCREHQLRQNEFFIYLKKRGISVTNGTEVKVTLGKA